MKTMKNEKILQEFKNSLIVDGIAEKTISNYGRTLHEFFYYLNKGAETIAEKDIKQYLSYLTIEKKNGASTRSNKISGLKTFFTWLLDNDYIIYNPMLKIKNPKMQKQNPVYLTETEAIKVLNVAKDNARDYAILMLMLTSGIRLEETSNLNIDDIREDTLYIISGKGNKDRQLHLAQSAKNAIDEYFKIRNSKENALFVSQKNNRMSVSAIQNVVKKYIAKAGLDVNKYSAHKLRHTAATLTYKNNHDILSLQKMLGHSDVSTTQRYAHLMEDSIKDAVNANPLANL